MLENGIQLEVLLHVHTTVKVCGILTVIGSSACQLTHTMV